MIWELWKFKNTFQIFNIFRLLQYSKRRESSEKFRHIERIIVKS